MIISVLVNTMNENPQWLKKSLESHMANNMEKQIIVSTMISDSNIEILLDYKRKGKIELFLCDSKQHPGKSPEGAYYQINAALHLVKGEYFYYFSSNDFVSHDKMMHEVNKCQQNKAKVCYSAFQVIDENEKVIGKRIADPTYSKYSYAKQIRGNYVSDASMVHVSLLKKYAPFRSDLYGNFAHWDFWMRIYEGEGNVFTYNPRCSFWYRQNHDSMHNLRKKDPVQLAHAEKMLVKLRAYNNRINFK